MSDRALDPRCTLHSFWRNMYIVVITFQIQIIVIVYSENKLKKYFS
jgi:hypothetical protein